MEFITRNQTKFVKTLQTKKNRQQERLFIVEGGKSVLEMLNSDFEVHTLFATDQFLNSFNYKKYQNLHIVLCEEKDLVAMGTFDSNNAALLVLKFKDQNFAHVDGLTLVLDHIADPGNLGTLIRTADWFGVKQIVCSPDTVDMYSAKVANSTMGSLARVPIFYMNLEDFFAKNTKKVYGAFLGGKILSQTKLEENAVLVIGNEAKGISVTVEDFVEEKITISGAGNTESLNASVAGAICLYEFFR
ncbi:MAG: RNA methyltransferase [Cytophagales bacterium]